MSEFVTVDIPQGKLRGKKVTSNTNGVTYYSFQGIPYAKPPVGPLRFKPPEDPDPWKGTRDALVEGAIAPQIDLFSNKFVGEEDCLFLNVYSPELSAASRKAVMVWIHGGAFVLGSGNSEFYGPDFLVAEDVVLVTINYRIGALGFLYTEGADITGNNGLRDQVMALKWVKNNISQFGGDPGNVTIFGESAGGISVHHLMLTPLAAGLFHRAIAQSGTALLGCINTTVEISSQRTARLAKFLGCTSEDPQDVVDFLRTVQPEKFVIHKSEYLSEEENRRIADVPYCPCDEVGSDAFLPVPLTSDLTEAPFTKVPFITGITSAEGKVMLMGLFMKQSLAELDHNFENVLPPDIIRRAGNEKLKEIATSIKQFYFGEKKLDDDTVAHFVDMMSDLLFVYPLQQTVQSQNKWSPHHTYVYLFDHKSEFSLEKLFDTKVDIPGVPHGAELQFLFHGSMMPNIFTPGTPDAHVQATLIKLWTGFAKTGNPSNNAVTWEPATVGSQNYLYINGGFSMKQDMYKDRLAFLNKLFDEMLPR